MGSLELRGALGTPQGIWRDGRDVPWVFLSCFLELKPIAGFLAMLLKWVVGLPWIAVLAVFWLLN